MAPVIHPPQFPYAIFLKPVLAGFGLKTKIPVIKMRVDSPKG
jgi:hypothetical protein